MSKTKFHHFFDQEEINQDVQIHEKLLNSITNFDPEKIIQDMHIHEKPLNSITIFDQEEIIHDMQQSGNKQTDIKLFCRLLPTPVCKKNLIQMRHERICHVLKGFIGKCEGCGEKFTTNRIIWNAIELWNDQCSGKICQSLCKNDAEFPLSKGFEDFL
jgi:hypothetical protein